MVRSSGAGGEPRSRCSKRPKDESETQHKMHTRTTRAARSRKSARVATLTNVNNVDLFALTFIYDMQHFSKCNFCVSLSLSHSQFFARNPRSNISQFAASVVVLLPTLLSPFAAAAAVSQKLTVCYGPSVGVTLLHKENFFLELLQAFSVLSPVSSISPPRALGKYCRTQLHKMPRRKTTRKTIFSSWQCIFAA